MPLKVELKDITAVGSSATASHFLITFGDDEVARLLPAAAVASAASIQWVSPDDGEAYTLTVRIVDGEPVPQFVKVV